jgi:ribose-phosphate pyrophosphokinase
MILFSTKKYEYLKKEFLKDVFFEEGFVKEDIFSDGEKYTKILSKFKNKDVAIVGATIDSEDIMDIYDMSCALVKLGARSLNIIIPFFGYSTMERAEEDGEIVKAKTRARLLSLIPTAYQGNNIILLDLHKDNISHYFENSTHAVNVDTNDLIIDEIKSFELKKYAFGATDEGGAKRVRKIADKMEVPAYFVLKKRVKEDITLESSNVIDKDIEIVILVDDMIRSGSSLIQAMDAYSKDNELKFIIVATHGIFCSDGFDKLRKDPRVIEIVVSNSHTGSLNKDLKTMNITKKITKTLKGLHDYE